MPGWHYVGVITVCAEPCSSRSIGAAFAGRAFDAPHGTNRMKLKRRYFSGLKILSIKRLKSAQS
jgi:hypothetical protein